MFCTTGRHIGECTESISLIEAVTGISLELEEKEGKVDMCKAIEDMKRMAEENGFKLGEESGFKSGEVSALNKLVLDGILTLSEAAARTGKSDAEFMSAVAELQ